jgi:hypothetical protein
MRTSTRSVVREFVLAGLSIVLAVGAGMAWLGQPLRMVQLLTIVGVSMTAGVSWARAVWRLQQERSRNKADRVA